MMDEASPSARRDREGQGGLSERGLDSRALVCDGSVHGLWSLVAGRGSAGRVFARDVFWGMLVLFVLHDAPLGSGRADAKLKL